MLPISSLVTAQSVVRSSAQLSPQLSSAQMMVNGIIGQGALGLPIGSTEATLTTLTTEAVAGDA